MERLIIIIYVATNELFLWNKASFIIAISGFVPEEHLVGRKLPALIFRSIGTIGDLPILQKICSIADSHNQIYIEFFFQ